LTFEDLKMMFETLPVDITYVSKDNTVKFYSEGDRIFPRTPSIIGRLVENCHPDKSVDKVLEIIESFKNNTLDKAEFWLEMEGRKIFIRYFPMRDSKGKYQGVLEVTQDITKIQGLEGEKRLL
ncbi:MAG: PAS domain-containing protein, partial [Candidatus Heimdallarchaeaceae archaeon]